MTIHATAQSFTPEYRRTIVGASEVAAIMGLSPYDTPLDIYNRKKGYADPVIENRHIRRGNRLEAVAAEYYTEITGHKLRRRTAAFVHPSMPYFVGHVDRLFEGEKRIWEAKCPSVAAYRKMQREGLSEALILQAQSLLGLSGHRVLTWNIFCADEFDAISFDIEFDAGIYKQIEASVHQFWTLHVVPDVPPAMDSKVALELAKVGGQDITHRDDEAFVKAVAAYREAKQIEADAKELIDLAKWDIADAVKGEFGIYEGGGLRVYYMMRDGRKSFDKAKFAKAHPDINLSDFDKTGSPFIEFKVYSITNIGAN